MRKNRRKGEQRGRKNYNREAEKVFFFFFRKTSHSAELRAALHCPSHRKLCGALPSGPSSMRTEFFLLLLSLHLSYPVLRLSGSLISYVTMSPGPLCVLSSLTLSFPVVPLICNSTSTSSLPLCPPSLTVTALQQITSALRDRHMAHAQTRRWISVNWAINYAAYMHRLHMRLRVCALYITCFLYRSNALLSH